LRTPRWRDDWSQPWSIKRDDKSRLRQTISPNGRVRTQDYGDWLSGSNRYRVTKLTNERGHYRTFDWDGWGNVAARRDEAGNVTLFEYDELFTNKLTRRTEPDGDEWTYEYDPGTGDLLRITDPLNEHDADPLQEDAVVEFQYTSFDEMDGVPPDGDPLPGRIQFKTKIDRNGHITIREYDFAGNLIQVTRGADDPSVSLVTILEHDAMGRTTRRVIERGDRQIVTQWTYDAMGRQLDSIQDPGTPPANLNLVTSRGWDGHGNLETLTDPKGIITKFEYDHRNRLEKRIDAFGTLNLTTEWFRDGNGNVERQVDPEGHETTYIYNAQNFLTSSTDAEGYVTTYSRDAVGNLVRLDRGLNPGPGGPQFSAQLSFDALNRLVQRIVDPDGVHLVTTIDYAIGGAGCSCGTPGFAIPYRIVDPAGKINYFHYDRLDRRTKIVRKVDGDNGEDPDADDAATEFAYDPQGNLTALVLAEDERLEFEYDAAHRRNLIRAIHVSGDIVSSFGYDGASNVSTVTQPNGTVIELAYDGANRLETATDDLGALAAFVYDKNNNVVERSTAIAGQTWTFDYDDADRLWKVFDPIIEAPDKYTEFLYDDNGNRVEAIDNNGVRTRYVYDALDRLVQMIENYQGTDDTADTTTSYGYNGARQVSISDHDSHTTNYVYDTALRLWKSQYPDNDPPGSGVVEYHHDPAGNVTWHKDQRGVETAYTYNDLHQLTGRSYGGITPPRSETFHFDRSGNLEVADNDVAQLDFIYDDLGRLDTATQTYVGGPAYTTQFNYVVAVGDVRRVVTYPNGRAVTETYDARVRLGTIDGGPGVGADFAYDLADRRTDTALGNGVGSVFGFDLANRLTSIQHASQVADLFHVEYGYDAVGNRLFTRSLTPGLADRSELYEYDQRHRLRRMQRGTISPGGDPLPQLVSPLADDDLAAVQEWPIDPQSPGLDRRGNWNEFAETIGVTPVTTTQTRSPNGVNEYEAIDPDGPGPQSPVDLAHDANGNVTLDPTARNLGDGEGGVPDPSGQVYEYDEENRLTAVRRAWDNALLLEIDYDAVGRRVASADYLAAGDPCGGPPARTRHVYAGLETLEEYLCCGTGVPACDPEDFVLAREFVWGDRFPQPVALVTHGGLSGGFGGPSVPAGESAYHYLHDVLGSVVALTDAAGQVVERYTYDPYGQTLIEQTDPATGEPLRDPLTGAPTGRLPASAFGNPCAWTGQRYDADVRLYHFFHRVYSPRLGRWLHRDPLDYVDGVNLYCYLGADPLYGTDPYGLSPDDSTGGGSGAGAAKVLQEARKCAEKVIKAVARAKEKARKAAEKLRQAKQKKAKQETIDKLEKELADAQDEAHRLGIEAEQKVRQYEETVETLADPSGPRRTAGALREELRQAVDPAGNAKLPADAQKAVTEIEQGVSRPNVRKPQSFANDGRGGTTKLPTTDADGKPITYTEHTVNPRPPAAHWTEAAS